MTTRSSSLTVNRRSHKRTYRTHKLLGEAARREAERERAAANESSLVSEGIGYSDQSTAGPTSRGKTGWITFGPEFMARGGLATAEDLVRELFNRTPDDPDFAKKRMRVYRLPGRASSGAPLWDRAALVRALCPASANQFGIVHGEAH